MRYSPTTKTGFPEHIDYSTLPDDLIDIDDDDYAALIDMRANGMDIRVNENGHLVAVAPPPPSPDEVLAASRATARIDRTAFCLALKSFSVLPLAEAVAAARGEWPATFDGFTASLSEDQAATAMIRWAGAQTIHYADPLLQGLALANASGNQAAATALLDQIFNLT